MQKKMPEWIEEITSGIAKAHGLQSSMKYQIGTQVLMNHHAQVDKAFASFKNLGGRPIEIPPTMGAEDFSAYLEKVPGAFAFLGAGDGTPRTAQSFHHPKYDIDEKALHWGSAFFVQVVLDRAGRA
jgi:amidohydrolase